MQPDPQEMQHELDDLDQEIAAAREKTKPKDEDEKKYYESGSIHPELDDQAITPPG